MVDLSGYTDEHRQELEALLETPAWQEVLRSGLVEEVRAERLQPGATRDFIGAVVDQLLALNRQRVAARIADGCRDREQLFDELATWPPDLDARHLRLAFVGLNLTADCVFEPRCIYCNQPHLRSSLDLDDWKRVLAEATPDRGQPGPYIYLTGGEPLLLGEQIWGERGLVRFATLRGAGVNINTNGTLLTPEVSLRLIKAGLLRLHISLDTADPALHDYLRGGPRFHAVVRGIYNIQLARDLVGATYPGIHTNCVLTKHSLPRFPELFAWILEKHKQTVDSRDPFFNDLFAHVIPVGGDSNIPLRPSAKEFRHFYQDVWAEVARLWDDYRERLGGPSDQRGPLFGYFSNPFLRVEHRGGLDAYVETSARGRYGALALARRCYVAPTQACVTPDGMQYRCGSHAIRHERPLGSVQETSVDRNILRGIPGLRDLPQEETCYGCALATLYVNQAVEKRLDETLDAMLG